LPGSTRSCPCPDTTRFNALTLQRKSRQSRPYIASDICTFVPRQ
jgi:hypothetical protein